MFLSESALCPTPTGSASFSVVHIKSDWIVILLDWMVMVMTNGNGDDDNVGKLHGNGHGDGEGDVRVRMSVSRARVRPHVLARACTKRRRSG